MRKCRFILVALIATLCAAAAESAAQTGGDAGLRQELADIREEIRLLREHPKPFSESWGPILVGLVAAGSGFAAAAYSARNAGRTAADARREAHLSASLGWFDTGTKKRSIGLSVIEAHLPATDAADPLQLRATWRQVLVAQAVYLLSATDSDEEHERQNLRRIHRLLTKMGLDGEDRAALEQSLRARKDTGLGLARLTEQDETNWRTLSSADPG